MNILIVDAEFVQVFHRAVENIASTFVEEDGSIQTMVKEKLQEVEAVCYQLMIRELPDKPEVRNWKAENLCTRKVPEWKGRGPPGDGIATEFITLKKTHDHQL